MNKNERTVLVILLLLLSIGFLFWHFASGPKSVVTTHPVSPLVPQPPIDVSTSTPIGIQISSTPVVKPAKPPKTSPETNTGPTGAPVAPNVQLHKELIPKNIEIVRCYYGNEVAPPGTTLGFDINGSGFTSEFEKMIKVDAGSDYIRVKNLHLVTTNQIHGEMLIGPEATTTFVFPRVLIKGLPVFRAADPFAVIRKGEVLTVFFISMEESGRAGRFRVLTHLDEALAKQFDVSPSTPGIKISDLEVHLPYAVEGRLEIAPGVPTGDYGMAIAIAGKEVFRRNGMIRIVRPNVGQSGFVQGILSAERFYRPGDTLQLYLQGTGFNPQDIVSLEAKIDEYDMGQASFTYVSGVQTRFSFQSPKTAPTIPYGVTVFGAGGKILFNKKDVFKLVEANWVAGVQVSPPIKPGSSGTLKVIGRDFSDEFAQTFKITPDDAGIVVNGLRRQDASTLFADIMVKPEVAPGDYWLHLTSNGQKIEPPFGSLIKVEKP